MKISVKKAIQSAGLRLGLFLTLFGFSSAVLASELPVDLGTAGNFTVLAKTNISATGTTTIVGNVGIAPAAASFITGFGLIADSSNQFSTSSMVQGRVYAVDYSPPTPAIMNTAVGDMQTAYTDAAGRAAGATELYAGSLGGKTLTPGVYKWSSGVLIATDMFLSGGANDIFIFQIAQTLDLSSAAIVHLLGGVQAKNVFWQVAGQVTLATGSTMNGNLLGQTAIVFNAGAVLNGKALAQSAVTLSSGRAVSSAGGYSGPNPPNKGQAFAYPSPARNGSVNFVYEMSEVGKVEIRVYNEIGDLVTSVKEEKLAGSQKSQVSVNAFAPGLYLFKVTMEYDSGATESLGVQKFSVAK